MDFFNTALPVWMDGIGDDKNVHLIFRARVPALDASELVIAAGDVYRVTVNGAFVGYGPARAAHGYARVDRWPVPALREGGEVCIEAASYGVNSFSYPMQPGFVQAELVCGGVVAAATGRDFTVEPDVRYEKKVGRFSYQRTFIEVVHPQTAAAKHGCIKILPARQLLCRGSAAPQFEPLHFSARLATGRVEYKPAKGPEWRQLVNIGESFLGYSLSELCCRPDEELLSLPPCETVWAEQADALPLTLAAEGYAMLRMKHEKTGMLCISGVSKGSGTLYLAFDEILSPEKQVNYLRMQCTNIVTLRLTPGEFRFETIEPYAMQYLTVTSTAPVTVNELWMREYAGASADAAAFSCSDAALNEIFAAAKNTFRQNVVDNYMDCPSRERAGWLCDSFFMARSEALLTGETRVENVFLENYARGTFAGLPEGMLAMCYPADHNTGEFIPNWAMWFVVELEEACRTRAAAPLAGLCREKVEKLFDYLVRFETEEGLLAKLENWVFVEWSRAADFVQDVNYPTNMLYAAALESAGRLYENHAWEAKGAALKRVIRKHSFDGTFFTDNAMLRGGRLEKTKNKTECCQYYAMFFGLADPEKDAEFFTRMFHTFGPHRDAAVTCPDVFPANAFIGDYLRLEMLRRTHRNAQVLEECRGYFAKMARTTGTLWENDTACASCNHGFASYTANLIVECGCGLEKIDTAHKTVTLRPEAGALNEFCCTLPVPDGAVTLRRENGATHAILPQGWSLAE